MGLNHIKVYYDFAEVTTTLSDAEKGRLILALVEYARTGETVNLCGNERHLFPMLKAQIERDIAEETRLASDEERLSEIRREAGKLGAQAKSSKIKQNQAKLSKTKQSLAKPSKTQQTQANADFAKFACVEKEKEEEKENKEKERSKEKENKEKEEAKERESAHSRDAVRHPHGQYGWVKLTEKEYNSLLVKLGEAELMRCIKYIDESAQKTTNKNKWRDWNLVIQQCARDKWGISAAHNTTAEGASTFKPIPDSERIARLRKLEEERRAQNDCCIPELMP